jgi:hypothetical protein
MAAAARKKNTATWNGVSVVTLETTQTPIERAVFFVDYSEQPE